MKPRAIRAEPFYEFRSPEKNRPKEEEGGGGGGSTSRGSARGKRESESDS